MNVVEVLILLLAVASVHVPGSTMGQLGNGINFL
jgi:hypothetical protein